VSALAAGRPPALAEAEVVAALAGVLDPELDRSIVELGFVRRVAVAAGPGGARVRVELRLPTYWCAPNFSWLMVEDARRVLLADRRVGEVEVVLCDHHAGGEISAGVGSGRTFEEVFGSGPDGRLTSLHELFRRKAFLVRQERALRPLGQSGGHSPCAPSLASTARPGRRR
jgi:metal-sulfur cluster biosynthetic enzyme